jgi:NAD(P)-dependent dehydrogenase (short-subunit alcohol dehydrogenase family)
MAAEGARVVVNDLGVNAGGQGRDVSPADAVVREILDAGGAALANHADVADFDAARRLVDAAVGEFGGLDALVNNAAIDLRANIDGHSVADWDRVMAINARGTFNCARHALPVMREGGRGAILNTTSGAFWEGTPGVAAYAASKAAVFALTLTLHNELVGSGVTANCISPHATHTRMMAGWLAELSGTGESSREDALALYGLQEPENLAPLAILLCSEAGRNLSGHVFEIWGDRLHVVAPPRRGPSLRRSGETWSIDSLAEALPGLVTQGLP